MAHADVVDEPGDATPLGDIGQRRRRRRLVGEVYGHVAPGLLVLRLDDIELDLHS